MTLSGRNGSSRRRSCARSRVRRSLDAGSITIAPRRPHALHDQRPPRSQASLREYVGEGLAWIAEIEQGSRGSSAGWRTGMAETTLAPYADAQGKARARGQVPLARQHRRRSARPWLRRHGARPAALRLLGRRADPGVAGAGDRLAARPAAARRAHQSPRHLGAGMARGYLVELDAAVVLVAHDRWFLESVGTSVLELEDRPRTPLPRTLARLARRAGRPRACGGGGTSPAARPDRAHAALRRAVSLQGETAPGPSRS